MGEVANCLGASVELGKIIGETTDAFIQMIDGLTYHIRVRSDGVNNVRGIELLSRGHLKTPCLSAIGFLLDRRSHGRSAYFSRTTAFYHSVVLVTVPAYL
jgi:hypothetical protein